MFHSGRFFAGKRADTGRSSVFRRKNGFGLPKSWDVTLENVEQMTDLFKSAGVGYDEGEGQPRSVEVLKSLFVDRLSAAATARAFDIDYGKIVRARKYIVNRLRPHLLASEPKYSDITMSVPPHMIKQFRALEAKAHLRTRQTREIAKKF